MPPRKRRVRRLHLLYEWENDFPYKYYSEISKQSSSGRKKSARADIKPPWQKEGSRAFGTGAFVKLELLLGGLSGYLGGEVLFALLEALAHLVTDELLNGEAAVDHLADGLILVLN